MIEEPTAHRAPEETPTIRAVEGSNRTLQLTPGTVLGERYRIVSLIGRGGMGEVYRADDLKLGQTVALKFLSRHGDAHRLYEEVRVGRQVSHPNVCRLHDIAEVDGHLFITMEYVDGEDLASLLRRVGRLPSEKALAVSRDICAGLAAAHEKGVIHRDLKPANVMIDGRGRARVTDFGLALIGERAADGAGTPAYMAPEQLAGEPASVRSDIYALGLMLYEIYTGRRAYEATSTSDLLQRQQRADFTRPSAVTRDVPAEIERVIARCLEPSPARRPQTVEEIALEMPGFDPLAAAIAAGEMPTPGMVAAAARGGDLPAPVAWAMLAIAIFGLVVAAFVSERTMLYRVIEVKAPDVLQEHARQILARAGVSRRVDSALILGSQAESRRIVATYRHSPQAMLPRNPDGVLRTDDPPLTAGMANVTIDHEGRLLTLIVGPPRIEAARPSPAVNWDPYITDAGFDPRLIHTVAPEWSAPVDTDRKAAWVTKDGQRIEAAQYHGRPVWFAVRSRNELRSFAAPPPPGLPARVAWGMVVFFLIALPIGAIVLARRHLQRRQGDRAGAFRTAAFFFVVLLIGMTSHAHHSMTFMNEWSVASRHIAQAMFWAVMTGVMYLALEPVVRRRWPQILISWMRLLAGRFTDPMVGRDVLMGAAGAGVVVLMWHASILAHPASFGPTIALGPPREVLYLLAYSLAEAVLRSVGLVVLIVLLRALIPSDVAATLLTIVLIAAMTLADSPGPLWLRALYGLTAAFNAVMLARHFGLLAVTSYAFFVLVHYRLPFTLDGDAWYFGRAIVVMIMLAAIMVYAFRVSVGTRRWLPQLAVD